jgi:hypothetical protein
MKSARTALLNWLVCLFLAGLWSIAAAQAVDPTKALIGTWEGTVPVGNQRERTIVIKSMKPKEEGGWVAQGTYGITGEKLGGQTYDVSLQNGEIVLEFVTRAKSPARLVLKGDNRLDGTINLVVGVPGQGQRARDVTFKLEKVEPKAGDVK